MEGRVLSHSLASCSGLARSSTSSHGLRSSQLAVSRPRLALRVQAVQSLSRGTASSASSLLNAPSAEEVGAPVSTVHSPEEFQDTVAANSGKMVVLMCKATHCRPCKLFAKTYAMAARQYTDAVFLEIIGDESKATRAMMIENKVKVTPTFLIFRDGEKVHSHGGINEVNLHRYISKFLQSGEAGFGSFVEPEEAAAAAAKK